MMTVPTRSDIIQQIRGEGQRLAAVLPIHYPRALLRAYGFHPMEVWGPPGLTEAHEETHFQEYVCSLVRDAVIFLRSEAGQQVDCILVPHTCDSLQGTGTVMQNFLRPRQPVMTLYHPRNRGSAGLEFLTHELERLSDSLREVSDVEPTDATLLGLIEEENQADEWLGRLCLHRSDFGLCDREFYSLVRAREYLPAKDFIHLAQSVPRSEQAPRGVKLMISGILPEPMELFEHINEFGGSVVADDLACGSRRVYAANQETDPLRNMAVQLLSAPPDPSFGCAVDVRNAYLIERMESTGARGMLFYEVKFCEPESFYLPQTRDALTEAGYPMLHVEVELENKISGQILTRLNTFLEVLQ